MMKIFKEQSKTVIFTVYFMLNSMLFFAQDEGPEGPPQTTIDAMLFPMIIIAVLFVAFNFHKKTTVNNTK